jgi:hypothetical protein
MEDEIRRQGIRLVPWIAGDVWEVLAALRKGLISDPRYAMPGRARCARRNRSQQCGLTSYSGKMSHKEGKNA